MRPECYLAKGSLSEQAQKFARHVKLLIVRKIQEAMARNNFRGERILARAACVMRFFLSLRSMKIVVARARKRRKNSCRSSSLVSAGSKQSIKAELIAGKSSSSSSEYAIKHQSRQLSRYLASSSDVHILPGTKHAKSV